MNNKIREIKEDISLEIEDFFVWYQLKMKNEWKAWKTYLKKFQEWSWMNLLNHLYWFDLSLCKKPNQEVIDGEDTTINIWIQITIEKDKAKFRDETISKFPPKNKTYLSKLIFLVLVFDPDWEKTYKKWTDLNTSFFNCINDIYTLDKIHRHIESFTDIDKVYETVILLYKMFPAYFEELVNKIKRIMNNCSDLKKIKNSVIKLQQETF